MFEYKYTFEHPEGVHFLPDFDDDDYLYLTEVVWYADQFCTREVYPTERGIVFSSVWKTKEDRERIHSVFDRVQEILDKRGEITVALGGTYKFEIVEIE